MKKINAILAALAATAAFASCNKVTTEGVSWTTTYAVITLEGADPYVMYLGEQYTDPGYSATMGSEDVTSEVKVDMSAVNTSKFGNYPVSYSITNPEGFVATASRSVYVVANGTVDNLYLGESKYGSRHYYNAPTYVTKVSDGIYEIDDLAGGFYWWGRYKGYEPTYDFHLEARVAVDGSGNVTLVSCDPNGWYWGEDMTITSGKWTANGGFDLVMDFSGVPMYVKLHPITK